MVQHTLPPKRSHPSHDKPFSRLRAPREAEGSAIRRRCRLAQPAQERPPPRGEASRRTLGFGSPSARIINARHCLELGGCSAQLAELEHRHGVRANPPRCDPHVGRDAFRKASTNPGTSSRRSASDGTHAKPPTADEKGPRKVPSAIASARSRLVDEMTRTSTRRVPPRRAESFDDQNA